MIISIANVHMVYSLYELICDVFLPMTSWQLRHDGRPLVIDLEFVEVHLA